MLDLPRSLPKRIALLLLAAFFVTAGVMHFTNAEFFVRIMPPWLPAHRALVYLSGVFEIAGGLGALWTRTRAPAGWFLVALLAAVFPANLHMALHPEQFPDMTRTALYARLPFQLVFMVWAVWATRPDAGAKAA